MAASETILSSWKTPFSTPIRKDENACRDIFQNSEKLLASAVSICRLKGSVECQTGGLITVCEELQSLIRLAFSEIRRLEKHFDSQRSNFEDEIACLKERVKYLEEVKGHSRETDSNDDCKEITETACNENNLCGKLTLREDDEHVEAGNSSLFVAEQNTEDSDPNIFGSTEVKVVSVHDGALHEPPNQHVLKSPQETRKGNSKRRFKKLALKKTANSSDVTNEVESLDMQNLPSEIEEKMENEDVMVIEKSEAKLQECESKLKDTSEKDQEKPIDKKKKKGSRALLENFNMESQDQIVTNDINHQAERKDAKKGKKKRSVDKEEELDEVFQVESSGEDVFQSEARRKSKEKKTKHSPIQEKSQRKSNQKLSCTKKSKSGSGNVPLKTGEDEMKGQPEPKEQTSQKKPVASTAGEMSSTSEKSSKKESVITEDKGEQLGDMSFLININSQISMFVADASQQERELQPMTARERNDVYKVTQLYKLRARIGTKTENNLTTVRLSKQADTRMPKPGRVDSLLSELSIAACKEAVKDSPKNHGKRKHPTSVEGNEQTAAEDTCSLDQDVPPKKKLSRLSRASKVHV